MKGVLIALGIVAALAGFGWAGLTWLASDTEKLDGGFDRRDTYARILIGVLLGVVGAIIIIVASISLSSEASAQLVCPAGSVRAKGTISPEHGYASVLDGCVRATDCRRAIPPFWRPTDGWVRTSYACSGR